MTTPAPPARSEMIRKHRRLDRERLPRQLPLSWTIAGALVLVTMTATVAVAHGSLEPPASRAYSCRFLEPENQMCQQTSTANYQAHYDWMEINLSGFTFGKNVSFTATPPSSPATNFQVALAIQSEWDSGYCVDATVTTTSRQRLDWTVEFEFTDLINSVWNADLTVTDTVVTAEGHAWNNTVAVSTPQSFGFCADRRTPTPVPPAPPSVPPLPPSTEIATPLSTQGRFIVDRNGASVILRGVNWFGFETANHLVHGLWTRDYDEVFAQIASLGYNMVRLPFSLQALASSNPVTVNTANGMNAALDGQIPLEAMDVIVDAAARHGILILLDHHSLADDAHTYGLWFDRTYSETDWIRSWVALADRYSSRTNVIGADLFNEPHGLANWGMGGAYDWRLAAERAGNAILAVAPEWLIIVEGVEGPSVGQQLSAHWWGGNLEGVSTHPVQLNLPNRVVYSPHEYGPGVWPQPWLNSYDPTLLADRWQKGFNYIATNNIAPILVGEFGGREVGFDTIEGQWQNEFVNFLAAEQHSFTYWSWNPNSSDTGGILTDDWVHIDVDKQAMLDRLLDTSSMPEMPETITLEHRITSDWNTGYCSMVILSTASTSLVDWLVPFSVDGTVTSLWNAIWTQNGSEVTAEGLSWNDTVTANAPVEIGFCANR